MLGEHGLVEGEAQAGLIGAGLVGLGAWCALMRLLACVPMTASGLTTAKDSAAVPAPERKPRRGLKYIALRYFNVAGCAADGSLGEDHDPGEVTQRVQKGIIDGLDALIAMANQQRSQQSSQAQGGKPGEPRPGSQSQPGAANTTANQPAKESTVSPGAKPPETVSGDIRQTAKEWGGLSARDRKDIIDSAGEDIVEKYRSLVEDYYRSLSVKASERK